MVLAGSQALGQLPVNGAVCGRGAEVIHDSAAQRTTSWRKRIGGGLLYFYFFFFGLFPPSLCLSYCFCSGALQLRAMLKHSCLSQEMSYIC